MAWLFERMIETAAWVAFILGLVFFIDAVWLLVWWAVSLRTESPAPQLLMESAQAAGAFVLSALAMGSLACIDRYVFDVPVSRPGK
jgi:hypothetical protein